MKKNIFSFLLFLLSTVILGNNFTFPNHISSFKHITFKNIPETKYSIENQIFHCDVNASSSAMIFPLAEIQEFKKLSFKVKMDGFISDNNSEKEKTKKGDDLPLRIGLMLSGKRPWIPFFASTWIKAVEGVMFLPSDKRIYYSWADRNSPGSKWVSPYSSSIENIVLSSGEVNDGWTQVQIEFPGPHKTVGLWMMCDGDDTKAKFLLDVKDFLIH